MVIDHALLCDPAEKAPLEARNGLVQLEFIEQLISRGATDVRESHVRELQRIAVQDIYPCAGNYRDARVHVEIGGSGHKLPHEALVPQLVTDACEWINANRGSKSGLERAAWALWRFNWIHPFAGGNGRTSRAIAYLILCLDMHSMLPGVPTVPSLIYQRRKEYIDALRAADAGEQASGEPDLSVMTQYMKEIVTRQLAAAIDQLDGVGPKTN